MNYLRWTPLLVAAGIVAVQANGQISYPTPDLSNYMPRAEANATVASIQAQLPKDVKSGLVSNASGFWTRTYPAGFWTGEPSLKIAPSSATGGTGAISYRATKTLANGQWTVSVQFTMLPTTVTVVVAGSTQLWVNPGTVAFDYEATEPNAA